MDEDELLYREMNPEDPWYMGDQPNEYEDDPASGDNIPTGASREPLPAHGAFLLFWNPANSNYTLERYAADRNKFIRRFAINWTIDEHEQAHEGDRYYMIRLGEGRTGIVWRGTFSSEPYQVKDFNNRWFVDIIVEDPVKPDRRPLVTMDELRAECPDADWEHMPCGQTITAELAERFDELTRINWYKESHPYKGRPSKEVYDAEQRREKRFNLKVLAAILFGVVIFLLLIASL